MRETTNFCWCVCYVQVFFFFFVLAFDMPPFDVQLPTGLTVTESMGQEVIILFWKQHYNNERKLYLLRDHLELRAARTDIFVCGKLGFVFFL